MERLTAGGGLFSSIPAVIRARRLAWPKDRACAFCRSETLICASSKRATDRRAVAPRDREPVGAEEEVPFFGPFPAQIYCFTEVIVKFLKRLSRPRRIKVWGGNGQGVVFNNQSAEPCDPCRHSLYRVQGSGLYRVSPAHAPELPVVHIFRWKNNAAAVQSIWGACVAVVLFFFWPP